MEAVLSRKGKMLPNYFVILWDNKPVGLDADSGGYPYKTDYPGNVRYWLKREDAEKFLDVFARSPSYGFSVPRVKIVEIQFRIMDKK